MGAEGVLKQEVCMPGSELSAVDGVGCRYFCCMAAFYFD